MKLIYIWLFTIMLALTVSGCSDQDSVLLDNTATDKTTDFAISLNVPENVTTLNLSIDAAENDRNKIWIDLNGDGIYAEDDSESIRIFNEFTNYNVKTQINTVTIYGKVTYLGCTSNELTALNISRNPYLTTLNASFNQLKSIDVSKNPALVRLDLSGNKIQSLDLSVNNVLTTLWVFGNQLIALDISANPDLEFLDCSSNLLTSLSTLNNPKLSQLICFNNQLTTLDVSQNRTWEKLWAYGNPLSDANVKKIVNTLSLTSNIDLWISDSP